MNHVKPVKPKPVRTYLNRELEKWIKKEAKAHHCSTAQVLRELIIAEMNRRKNENSKST